MDSVGSAFEPSDQCISIGQVPTNVVDAVETQLPGIKLVSAELRSDDGERIYELEGTRDGEQWQIEVSADGEILGVARTEG